MSRSHKIWVDVSGGSGKSFGCGDDDIRMNICVGSSASYSRHFSTIRLRQSEYNGEISFSLEIDGQTYRTEKFDKKKKEFRGITGRRITGNPKVAEKKEKESANSMLKMVANIAAMGEFFAGDSKKEKNDWKSRMIKAGLGNKGLIMPEDWDTLTEDEKEKRLNGVIEVLREEPKK